MATMPRVAIAGYGYSTVGRNTGLSLDELTAQSSAAAMLDAGISAKEIDGIVVHSSPNQYVSSTHTAAMLGIPDLAFYSSSVDGAAYSVAAMHAIAAIASGSAETVLTIRTIQKRGAAGPTLDMIDPTARIDGPGQLAAPYGIGGPSWAAFYMQRHMAKYGSTEEDFGAMAIAQRKFATNNPSEAFHTDPLTMDDYMNSRYIYRPLHMLDCDYPIDSSSALIFTTEERARDMKQKPVFFDSWANGTTEAADFSLVKEMTQSSPWMASKRMWSRTDLKPKDVQTAGLYDGFTFIAMQWMEALGFCDEGQSGAFIRSGATGIDGSLPTNTDGGACNVGRRHGANFFIEVARQLRGTAGDRALPNNPKVGVVSNAVGGFAACALLTAE